jgi:dihydrolipoamide dehydrogenase
MTEKAAQAAFVLIEFSSCTGQSNLISRSKKLIAFKKAIIAAGSQAVRLPFMHKDGLDKGQRMVGSTGTLELKEVPKRMLILGGGIIGLEMGTIYSTLVKPFTFPPLRKPYF